MIPLFKPYMPKELDELNQILYSGSLSYGKYCKLFENSLKKIIGCQYLLCTNTYSNAITIALSALELKKDDEVITSPMSCLASNQPLLTYGLNVKFADIDTLTGTLNPICVEKQLSKKTKLIFHNHFCGYPGYIDEINLIGKIYGIPVIDDCVESFGSKYKDRYLGNVGTDISVFSFQTIRLPNCIEGGAIVFKEKKLYERALLIRDFGIDRNIFRDANGEISKECDITLKGYSGTLSEVNGYIGNQQMKDIEDLLSIQRTNANNWDIFLKNKNMRTLDRQDIAPNYWVYGILTNNKQNTMFDFRKKGYYASGVHLPNNYYSIFQNKQDLPGVNEFYSKFLAIPCGWWFNKD